MATQIATAELTVIKAAGGILLRSTPRGQEIMVVYRKDHRDWVLPKGKLRGNESYQEAALREVEEETGCRCHLADYLGTISYAQSGIPKVVMFWKMSVQEQKQTPENNARTDSLWMPLSSAISRLTYAQEKSLLARLTETRRGPVPLERHIAPPPAREVSPELQPARESAEPSATREVSPVLQSLPATVVTPISAPRTKPVGAIAPLPKQGVSGLSRLSGLWQRNWSLPESNQRRVLQNEMEALQVEVAFLECRDGILDITWASAAWECLQKVKQYLKKKDMSGGWRALRAARRYSILGLNPVELCARGQILREEARKMTSWRGAAIQKLLATADDHLTAPRIADAMALRDEDHAEQTEQARTFMARMRLLMILCVVAAVAMLASLSTIGAYYDYAPLGFLGLVGSALAAVQLLIQARDERKMPGRVMMLIMVLGGAIAGLAADAIYRNIAHFFKLKHDYDFAVYLLAFVLGYAGQKILARLSGYSRAPEQRAIYY